MIQFENTVNRFSKMILTDLKEKGITCWIAGGAVRDYFSGQPLKTDIDLFFPNDSEYKKCADYFKTEKAEIVFDNDNGMKVKYNGRTFDLVKKYFATPKDTIDAFDFTVSMFAVDTENVYHGETSFIDLAKRQLMLNKLPFPASTMSRAFRYYNKGFKMCKGEMKKLVEAIQQMPKEEKPKEDGSEEASPESESNSTFFFGFD